MPTWTTFPPPLPDRPLRCRSLAGTTVLFQKGEKKRHIQVSILNATGEVIVSLQPHLRMGAAYILSVSDDTNAIMLFFRDGLRHPAGDQSGLSWFNAEGKGFLRVIDEKHNRIVLLPLMGLVPLPDAPIESRHGTRGPSRSADL